MRIDEYTLDVILKGKLRFYQKKKGYRFSIDSLLLGNFVEIKPGERALEIGSGCGIVSIMASKRFPEARIYSAESQKDLYVLSRLNGFINGTDNVTFFHYDIREHRLTFSPGIFDVIFSNPPYRERRSGKVPPSMEKLLAKHQVTLTPEDLAEATSYLLKNRGRLYLIYRPRRLLNLLQELSRKGINTSILVPIFSEMRGDAELVLIKAEKGTNREMEILGPISLYDGRGRKTPFHLAVSETLFPSGMKLWKERKMEQIPTERS